MNIYQLMFCRDEVKEGIEGLWYRAVIVSPSNDPEMLRSILGKKAVWANMRYIGIAAPEVTVGIVVHAP